MNQFIKVYSLLTPKRHTSQ